MDDDIVGGDTNENGGVECKSNEGGDTNNNGGGDGVFNNEDDVGDNDDGDGDKVDLQ